jgi:hypothetical protein
MKEVRVSQYGVRTETILSNPNGVSKQVQISASSDVFKLHRNIESTHS